MKSIIFAALIAIAAADDLFANVASSSDTMGSSTTEAVVTDSVDATPVVEDAVVQVVTDASADLINTDEYTAATAAWENDTKINTTDYHLNAANKADMVDFAWDNFDMSEFTFTDLLDLLASDSQVEDLKDAVKSNYVTRYEEECAKLPQVCASGEQCRKDIKITATEFISTEW